MGQTGIGCHPWIAALCILAGSLSAPAQEGGLEPVTLQLKWTHQFQFAGYYLALERGYYREAGLEVRIVEGGPAINVAEEVVSGRAEFGVGTSELLLDYAAGKPVVVLGVIYQHSPQALATRSDLGVRTLEELRGRTIMMEESASDLLTMLRMEGVTADQFTIVPHNVNPEVWHESSVAAISTYTSDEPFLMDRSGSNTVFSIPRPTVSTSTGTISSPGRISPGIDRNSRGPFARRPFAAGKRRAGTPTRPSTLSSGPIPTRRPAPTCFMRPTRPSN